MRRLAAAAVLAALTTTAASGGTARIVASWKLTPGVLNRNVTQGTIGATICVHGWTRTILWVPETQIRVIRREQVLRLGRLLSANSQTAIRDV